MGKKKLVKKRARIEVYTYEQVKGRLQTLAETYAGGNMSAYLVWAGLNVTPKVLSLNDLESK